MAAASSIIPATTSQVTSAVTGSSALNTAAGNTIAGNFQAFLQLLTTQLKNQNPLDPLDTNQFTQQLVQFAQVEQQLKSNDQLATLVSLQKTAQSTAALSFVGATVTVDGSTARLANGTASWNFNVGKPATGQVTITNGSGQTVYSGSFAMQAGPQNFVWDGRGNNGVLWPDGAYTISVIAKDASGQNVAVSTGIEGVVESVDLTKSPPELLIGGQYYTLDKIRRIVKRGTTI
jgi:flagellar basal-body rod modification protein FlgD